MKKALLLIALIFSALAGYSYVHGGRVHAQTTYSPSTVNIVSAGTPAPSGWTVTSSDGTFNCQSGSGACSAQYTFGQTITLTATPPPGYVVLDFSDDNADCGMRQEFQTTCTVTVGDPGGPYNVSVYWAYASYNLQVKTDGSGSGHVTSSPAGINCPGTCSASFPVNSNVTLSASATSGSTFASWGNTTDMGYYCQPDVGLGGNLSQYNTTASCPFKVNPESSQTYTAVAAWFNASAAPQPTSSSGSTAVSSASKTPAGTSTPAPSPAAVAQSVKIQLPPNAGLSLWNDTNFNMSVQALGNSPAGQAAVGLAYNNQPIAIVDVDPANPQDWAQANLKYGSDQQSHKAFVHGLTAAPGVVSKMFTLLIPYQAGDKYVGICPGVASISQVAPSCPSLYYLTDGGTATSTQSSSIPQNDTVKAKVVHLSDGSYWEVSGLTGTGGFSTNDAKLVAKVTKAGMTSAKAGSSTLMFAAGGVVVVLLAAGLSAKWWLPKLKKPRPTVGQY